jgi:G3E family GTPase
MSEVNIDAQLVRDGGAQLSRTDEKLIEMSNGCICCTLREDLLAEVSRLANERRFDYLLIESTGVGEPLPVAMTFSFNTPDGSTSLADISRLDTMVTVVDANTWLEDYRDSKRLKQLGMDTGEGDDRTLADLFIDQVEFANVIVINKTDLAGPVKTGELESVLRTLNPTAKLICADHSRVPLRSVLNTGMFDMEAAQKMPGWLKELQGEHIPETEEYGISSFVYRARRPFHPARLAAVFHDNMMRSLLRSKGLIWLATRNDDAIQWSYAGRIGRFSRGGRWFASVPADQQPTGPEVDDYLNRYWVQPYGDRRQEIVFIGIKMPQQRIVRLLNGALLNEDELQLGESAWAALPDPLPDWD